VNSPLLPVAALVDVGHLVLVSSNQRMPLRIDHSSLPASCIVEGELGDNYLVAPDKLLAQSGVEPSNGTACRLKEGSLVPVVKYDADV
jgi:hypothetical protein